MDVGIIKEQENVIDIEINNKLEISSEATVPGIFSRLEDTENKTTK